METLTAELRTAYPNEIEAISFENAPPLDPATIFIDFDLGLSPNDQLRFLCDTVKPRVDAVHPNIAVFTDYGWTSPDDCTSR